MIPMATKNPAYQLCPLCNEEFETEEELLEHEWWYLTNDS